MQLPCQSASKIRVLKLLLVKLTPKTGSKYRCPILICDDAFGLHLDPGHILRQFEHCKSPVILIEGTRNSSYVTVGSNEYGTSVSPDSALEVQHELTADEFLRLRDFLIKLEIASDADSANAMIKGIPAADATDILCSLWYLVPETKAGITASIQDEYARLGGISGAIFAYASAASEQSEFARRAYECVAVASSLGISIPMEVLVRCIKADFQDWRAMCIAGRPVWGLLYDDVDEATGNVVYKTRNHVVTKVLLELVNGGAGHAGEFRILKELVAACDHSTLPYHSFLSDLLAGRRRELERILTDEWGVELYELALKTFPLPIRLLEHHFGTWHRRKGGRPRVAYEQYKKALETENYPHTERIEPTQNIHTSMAATVVEMVKSGDQARESALDLIQMHLQSASSVSHFDPYSDHIVANSLFQLAKLNTNESDDVGLRAVADSLRTIEKSLQMIGAKGRFRREYARNIQALHDLQNNILGSIRDVEQLKALAEDSFRLNGSQSGYEVVGRRLLSDSIKRDRGSDFKATDEYIEKVIEGILETGALPSADLIATRVDIYIRWRLQRTRGPVDWQRIKVDLEKVLGNAKYQTDIVKKYYLGVALFHLDEFTSAESVFRSIARLRPSRFMMYWRRNFLLGAEGAPRRLQGEIRRLHDRSYVFVAEIQRELEVDGSCPDFGNGATVHVYVAFSFAGPRAIFDSPEDRQSEMP